MNEASLMWNPITCDDLGNVISSPVLAAGRLLPACAAGPKIARSGLARSPASLGLTLAFDSEPPTGETCGITSIGSSRSASLQRSLESKLQAQFPRDGLTGRTMTWRPLVTPAGRVLFQLQVSGRATTASASGWLPTPSGTSNHGKNHVAGRLDEWGGRSNPWRGTPIGKVHSPAFELWMMGYPATWREQMPPATQSCRKSRRR